MMMNVTKQLTDWTMTTHDDELTKQLTDWTVTTHDDECD